jgi:nitroreductase
MNELTELLAKRVSHAQLQEPAPSPELLEQLLAVSLGVPDHLQLRPWRFLTIRGDARFKLGELFASAQLLKQADCSQEQVDKLKSRALRAPLIVVGICKGLSHEKVPELEQQLSTGCVLHNLGLALYSMGYGAIWRTGSLAHDATIRQGLGLNDEESIVGYLYIGTPCGDGKTLKPLAIADYLQHWE